MKKQKLGEHEIVRAARAFADFHREVSGINIKAPRQEMLNSAAGASGWYLYWQQRNGEAPASAEYEETQKEREERQKKARVFLCKVLRKASTEGFNVEALRQLHSKTLPTLHLQSQSREEKIKMLQREPYLHMILSEEERSDRELALIAVSRNGSILNDLPVSLWMDFEVVKTALNAPGGGGLVLHCASKAVQIEWLRGNGSLFEHLTEEQRSDSQLLEAAMSQDVQALRHASDVLKIKILEQDGLMLRHLQGIKNSVDVVLAAVNQNGLALQYWDPSSFRQEDIAARISVAAMRQSGLALLWLPQTLLMPGRPVNLPQTRQASRPFNPSSERATSSVTSSGALNVWKEAMTQNLEASISDELARTAYATRRSECEKALQTYEKALRARQEAERKRASAWGDRRKAAGKRVVVAYDEGELELVRYRGTVMASVKGGLKVRFDGDDEDQLYLVDADDEWEWEADPGPNDAGAPLKESTSTDEAPIDKDDEQDVQDDENEDLKEQEMMMEAAMMETAMEMETIDATNGAMASLSTATDANDSRSRHGKRRQSQAGSSSMLTLSDCPVGSYVLVPRQDGRRRFSTWSEVLGYYDSGRFAGQLQVAVLGEEPQPLSLLTLQSRNNLGSVLVRTVAEQMAAAMDEEEEAPAIQPDTGPAGVSVKQEDAEPVVQSKWPPIDVEDPEEMAVVKLCSVEVAAEQQARESEMATLLQQHTEAAQHQEQQRRATRLKMYHENKDKTFADPMFKCPHCYYPNSYPREERACNKLQCGNSTCCTKFCIVCGKAASASCACIAAAWAR